jgi:hypothetical protein
VARSTTGLAPPPWAPIPHPLLWWEDGCKKRPEVVRFSWLPVTGDLFVGVQMRHALQIPRDGEYPFAAFLRGFYFPHLTELAVRTYFWGEGPYDWWDESHHRLDTHVAFVFLHLIRPSLPRDVKSFVSVDNRFLKERYGHLALDW